MKTESFHTLFQRHGCYSLPVLIELRQSGRESWYFTNNQENVLYGGKEYVAATMDYKPPSTKDGVFSGGSLEITIEESAGEDWLLKWVDLADHTAEMICVAFINDGTVTPIGQYQHQYGSLSCDGEKIVWNFGENANFNMQVNPWTFSPDALTG
jgi:hypothetical protein